MTDQEKQLRRDNFTKMFSASDKAHKEYMQERFSAVNVMARALDGFYTAYLQLNLPSCLANTLQEETKRMVQELYTIQPDCRDMIIHIIEEHGKGKGVEYIPKKIAEMDGWIMEIIERQEAQLTEELHEHNAEPDN